MSRYAPRVYQDSPEKIARYGFQKISSRNDQSEVGQTKDTPHLFQSARPLVKEHIALLSSDISEDKKIRTVSELQQSYGNAYVQELLARARYSSKSESAQNSASSQKLSILQDGGGGSFGMSTSLGGSSEQTDQEEPSIDEERVIQLPAFTLEDSISPAKIDTSHETVAGGASIPGGAFGVCDPYVNQNVHVEKKESLGGMFTDYEVDVNLDVYYNWGVQSLGKIDIPSADAPAVTADTWQDIAVDLYPAGGGIPRSPRIQYWCSDLSAQHELYHALDYQSAFRSFQPAEHNWLASQDVRSMTSAKNKGVQAGDRLVQKVLAYMGTGDDAACESRAYGAGVPLYAERAQSLQDRAEAEGWLSAGEEENEDEDEGDEYYEVDGNEEEEDEGDEDYETESDEEEEEEEGWGFGSGGSAESAETEYYAEQEEEWGGDGGVGEIVEEETDEE